MDEHVRYTKQRNPKALSNSATCNLISHSALRFPTSRKVGGGGKNKGKRVFVTYGAKAEAGDETAVKESEGEERDRRNGVSYGENVVKFERAFPGPVMGFVHVPERCVP